MTKPHPGLILIMPVFQDRPAAMELMRRLVVTCPTPLHVVAIEDGSVRDLLTAADIAATGNAGEVIYLARNLGHQRAIATGLAYIASTHPETNAILVMDCDGEDRPEDVPHLLAELGKGEVDAVVALRRKRSESLGFRAFYILYRFLFSLFTGRSIRFGNFAVLSMRAVRRLSAMQELWVHFAASIMVSRLRVATLPVDRGTRYAGSRSTMNFVSLTLHGMRSMMVFAEDVLVRVGVFCILLGVAAALLLGTSVLLKLVGFATPGWFSVAVGILVLMLMQASILTFVTLMITGILRSAPPIPRTHLDLLIERIETTALASVPSFRQPEA